VCAYGVSCRAHAPPVARKWTCAGRALRPQQRPIRPIQTTRAGQSGSGSPVRLHPRRRLGRVEQLFVGYSARCGVMCDGRHTWIISASAVLNSDQATHVSLTYLRSDIGPEFIAWALRDYCRMTLMATSYIEPGSPWENQLVESFNGRLRDELSAQRRDRVGAFDCGGGRYGLPPQSYWVLFVCDFDFGFFSFIPVVVGAD
jgi:hypothetical protein